MAGMDDRTAAGHGIVRVDIAGTAVVVAAGVLGLLSNDLAKTLLVPVSSVTGVVGLVAFVWSYLRAVGRSRQDEISVSQLYVVAGNVAPGPVKRALRWSLWVQVIVAIVVMFVGFQRTEPQEFNWAATIIVAPLFGMGLNGVWVSIHGAFGPRIVAPRAPGKRRSKRATGGS
jgi:energy-converting hydrogenase Eha subunit A